jgi:hypothetical protein
VRGRGSRDDGKRAFDDLKNLIIFLIIFLPAMRAEEL